MALVRLICLLLLASVPCLADTITIGAPGNPFDGDCAPFGCTLEYQQVYGAALFPGAITITDLTFFNDNFVPGSIAEADYTISLSTTAAPVDGLDATFANNLGADNAVFFSGALRGLIGPTNQFTLAGTPFAYDPANGNLLLTVSSDGSGLDFSVFLDFLSSAQAGTFSRISSFDTSGVADTIQNDTGIVTQFTFSPATSAVPEPGSLWLLIAGVMAFAILEVQRKSRLPCPPDPKVVVLLLRDEKSVAMVNQNRRACAMLTPLTFPPRNHQRIFCLPFLSILVLAASGVQPASANGVNAPIGNGQAVTGTVSRSGVDSYTFPVPVGGSIFASLSEVGPHISGNDLRIDLNDPSGNNRANDFEPLYMSLKAYDVAAGGTWTVKVSVQGANVGNSYTLTVITIPGNVSVPSGHAGGPMYQGATYPGSIYRGDVDVYTFNGVAGPGNTATLTVAVPGGSWDPAIRVFSPNGTDLGGTFDRSNFTYTLNIDPRISPVWISGTYTVLVYQFSGPDVANSYSISVSGTGVGLPDNGKSDGTFCLTCACGGVAAGDPINVATGNLYEQVTDYATAGANPIGFTRFYNSLSYTRNLYPTLIGQNWRTNYDRYLRLVSASQVTAERPDGRVLNFSLAGGIWTPDTDVDMTLTNAGSIWTLTDSDDTVETYSAASGKGTLNSIALRNGYTQTLNYTSGALTGVTDSYNRSLGFIYTGGVLTGVATPDSLILIFGYAMSAGSSVLTSVAYNTSPVTSQTYLYENTTLPFALTGIIDENGNRYATWSYDGIGRATSSQHAGGAGLTQVSYDDSTGNRTVTNAPGQQTLYKFTILQSVPKVTVIDRLASSTTAAATTTLTYDGNGYLASQTDWNGNLTTYVNDIHGQPTTINEASGTPQARATTITYHATFHLPVQIVTPGITTALAYDAGGNLLTKTLTDTTTGTSPYSTNGQARAWTYTWSNFLVASAKGPRSDVSELTSFTYDASGALIKTSNALGQQIQVTQHTGGGLPQTIVDANGVTRQLAYDARLRLTGNTLNTGAGALTTIYAYDAAGNILSVTLPDGSKLTNAYDAAHRLTSVTDLFSQNTSYTLDALGGRVQTNVTTASHVVKRTRSDSFDALGRLLQDTGGAGQATKFSYDGNGNALTVTDPLGRVASRAFDALNRLFRVTDPANGAATTSFDAHDRPLSVTAPNGAVTSYIYDGFGDLIQTSSPDTGKTIYRYDLAGNLTQKADAAGAVANYSYDALDRPLTATYPADAAENVSYIYDQAGHGFGTGRLTSVTDAVGTLSRTYDERGNVLSESRVHGSLTLLTSYAYDAASRIASITYPSGAKAAYTRDAMGRITNVTMTPKNGSAQSVATGIGYQPFGPVSALTFGNGIAETRSFDLDYRLTNLAGMGSAAVQNLTYGYNAADNLLSIADAVAPANNQNLSYDMLDRLTGAGGAYGTLAYTYDSVGNRLTQQTGATGTVYSYTPQSNRLTQIRTGTALQVLSYTPAGNITTFANVPSTRPATGIGYNQAGRLATVLSGGQQTMQYTYDAFGHRLVKVGNLTATTLSQYDQAGHLLEQTDGTGSAQVDYIYLGDRPLATFQPNNGKLYFLHDDRLGTPQVATDSTQAAVWTASYEPFGYTATGVGIIAQNLRLPGQEFEIETGWNHNGFRDYMPTLGRYLESDPIGLGGGLNGYLYADANPLDKIDPTGQISREDLYEAQRIVCMVAHLCTSQPDPEFYRPQMPPAHTQVEIQRESGSKIEYPEPPEELKKIPQSCPSPVKPNGAKPAGGTTEPPYPPSLFRLGPPIFVLPPGFIEELEILTGAGSGVA